MDLQQMALKMPNNCHKVIVPTRNGSTEWQQAGKWYLGLMAGQILESMISVSHREILQIIELKVNMMLEKRCDQR